MWVYGLFLSTVVGPQCAIKLPASPPPQLYSSSLSICSKLVVAVCFREAGSLLPVNRLYTIFGRYVFCVSTHPADDIFKNQNNNEQLLHFLTVLNLIFDIQMTCNLFIIKRLLSILDKILQVLTKMRPVNSVNASEYQWIVYLLFLLKLTKKVLSFSSIFDIWLTSRSLMQWHV